MSAVASEVFTSSVDEDTDDPPREGEVALWSVTSVIDCVGGNQALINWAANVTADAAIAMMDQLPGLLDSIGPGELRKLLAGQRFARPKGKNYSATGLGTCFHAAAHQYVLTGVRPQRGDVVGFDPRAGMQPDHRLEVDDEVLALLRQLDGFLDTEQPEFTAVEAVVFNEEWGYAGQADAWCSLQGVDCLIDYKTHREAGRAPYPSVALQLAAYRNAQRLALRMRRFNDTFSRRYYLLDAEVVNTSVPVPHTDATVVVNLTPSSWSLWKVHTGPEVFESFGYAMEAARWTHSMSSGVLEKLRDGKG